MTHRTPGRHRRPTRLATAGSTLTRSAAVAATSTGLLAGAAVTSGATPQDGTTGVAAADALLRVADHVAATERPAVAAKAPDVVDVAMAFGTTGFSVARVVAATPAAEQAAAQVAQRESTAASRTQERTAAPVVEEQAAPAAPAPVAAQETQAAPAQETRAEPEPAPAPEPAPVQQAAPAPTGGVLSVAGAYTGIPYVWGGTTPAGFDCSGYTQFVFAQVGISLPRTAAQQQAYATPVSNPQPGDLVFYGYPAYHMGIYAGNGMMYDSPRPGKFSSLRPMFAGVSGYGRVGG
ncbi:MAG TPA: C40 family peptidase [Ornithinimicrobium sp.]|nr:C40 family peptidase [Ornithinimicrobium sp.]